MRNHNGWTAYLKAIRGGHIDVAEILLAHGADPDARVKKGRNAMDIAKKYEIVDAIEFLQNKR